jgi:REP element-mobilizing transposase RayT
MSAPARRFSESPRLRSFDYRGNHAYHLTIVTADRRPVLLDNAELLRLALVDASAATAFDVLVFSMMPDHLHILAAGTSPDSNLVRFVQRFKQLTGYAFKQRAGTPLWQRSYNDHVLRRAEDVRDVGKYILENPVRAGFTQGWEDWPYSGGSLIEDSASFAHP